MRILCSRPDLCKRARMGLRIRPHDRFGDGTREVEAFRDGTFGLHRNNHVQPATGGRLHPVAEPDADSDQADAGTWAI